MATLSEIINEAAATALVLANYAANNPTVMLPPGDCEKLAAAIATFQAVYRDNCNGGV
jgi:hypothetical protein